MPDWHPLFAWHPGQSSPSPPIVHHCLKVIFTGPPFQLTSLEEMTRNKPARSSPCPQCSAILTADLQI
ncbi:hypothetical protein AGIG_G6452 [Arapaima gigas]